MAVKLLPVHLPFCLTVINVIERMCHPMPTDNLCVSYRKNTLSVNVNISVWKCRRSPLHIFVHHKMALDTVWLSDHTTTTLGRLQGPPNCCWWLCFWKSCNVNNEFVPKISVWHDHVFQVRVSYVQLWTYLTGTMSGSTNTARELLAGPRKTSSGKRGILQISVP